MDLKILTMRAAAGLFAVGIAATALIGGASKANAECPSPPCFTQATPSGGFGINSLPDLTVTEVKVDKVVNTLIIQLTIYNIGSPTTTDFRTDVRVDGVLVKQYHETGLNNGRYYTFSVPAPAGAGTHSVAVITDAGGQMGEKLESNNSKWAFISY